MATISPVVSSGHIHNRHASRWRTNDTKVPCWGTRPVSYENFFKKNFFNQGPHPWWMLLTRLPLHNGRPGPNRQAEDRTRKAKNRVLPQTGISLTASPLCCRRNTGGIQSEACEWRKSKSFLSRHNGHKRLSMRKALQDARIFGQNKHYKIWTHHFDLTQIVWMKPPMLKWLHYIHFRKIPYNLQI